MVSDVSRENYHPNDDNGVLILVLMEYGLGQRIDANNSKSYYYVLILVLMEYGLGLQQLPRYRCKLRYVLILVLMEYGLGLNSGVTSLQECSVLILVLMEYGLGHRVECDR